jgi:hypothetical protein
MEYLKKMGWENWGCKINGKIGKKIIEIKKLN